MESSALQHAESVCVKVEPCEAVFITDKPMFEEVSVKAESLLDDVCVKEESLGGSPADAAVKVYADHALKDEPVLGPVVVDRRSVRHAPTGQTPQKKSNGGHETYQCTHCKYTTVEKLCLIRHLKSLCTWSSLGMEHHIWLTVNW
ncbi:uncharacterized protein LOC133532570 isoform X3 [Cydia pomonella]|uniref:uncharacterized protein LOC133532570 isoform X3 n=1 Tax=Cydia pomonella TaxID=82600 RepID=UPI002ADDB2D8|nr:uncharacterized protein LOC133532570 isoform X3 [Cydia pomonella]